MGQTHCKRLKGHCGQCEPFLRIVFSYRLIADHFENLVIDSNSLKFQRF